MAYQAEVFFPVIVDRLHKFGPCIQNHLAELVPEEPVSHCCVAKSCDTSNFALWSTYQETKQNISALCTSRVGLLLLE